MIPLYSKAESDNLVIGLCGYAGSGKDLFFELLSKRIKSLKRFALADELKLDMRDSLLSSHGIDVLSCSREEKRTVRHLLVEFGAKRRLATNGKYWTDRLGDKILPISDDICITDIRYAFYRKDEHTWLKEELRGTLVWIDQYHVDVGEGSRIYNGPPNKEEKKNGPLLRKHADYIVEWEKVEDKSELCSHIDKFILWKHDKKEGRRLHPS